MSPSYSGSTLLTRILAQYDKISTIGELKATGIDNIHTYHCSCGARFLSCEFWNELADELRSSGVTFSLEALQTRILSQSSMINLFMTPTLHGVLLEKLRRAAFALYPGAQKTLNAQLERNAKIIEAICELQQGDVFLDESKDPLRAMYFANSDLWDFRVVQLVRDGRGTINSDIKHNRRTVKLACGEWNLKIDEMARFQEMAACEIMHVTYEALCTDIDSTVSKILQFSGVPEALESSRGPQNQQHIIGNDMRLKPMRDVKLDEKWRADLSAEDLEVFDILSGERNSELGYSN